MTKLLSDKKVKGIDHEHEWSVKVTMKYGDDEDIIGNPGCFRIGVVTGERYWYLTGDGKFVDDSEKEIAGFYNGKIKNGDKVTVKLNFTFGRIEYKINGEELGVAHKFGCHKKCRKNYKFYAYFKKKEICVQKLGYNKKETKTWKCEKCETLMKIKSVVCKYCGWSRISGSTKGYVRKIQKLQEYESNVDNKSDRK